jgi:hypothetical protein
LEPFELPPQRGVAMGQKLLLLRLLLCFKLQFGSLALVQVEVDAGELALEQEVDLVVRQGNSKCPTPPTGPSQI